MNASEGPNNMTKGNVSSSLVSTKEEKVDAKVFSGRSVGPQGVSKTEYKKEKEDTASEITFFQRCLWRITGQAKAAVSSILGIESEVFTPPVQETGCWMGRIYKGVKRSTSLADCTILGSHDSATCHLSGLRQRWTVTQAESIDKQLEAGVRYLDIRITRTSDGEHVVHHGSVTGGSVKHEVLSPLEMFLERSPCEVVVLKLKFSNMSKEQVLHYLDDEMQMMVDRFAFPVFEAGAKHLVHPGNITFNDIDRYGKNLVLLVSDGALEKGNKLKQEDLGGKAWRYEDVVVTGWANRSYINEVVEFNNRKVLPAIRASKKHRDGKIGVLQMQTNPNKNRGVFNSTRSLAFDSNPQIPKVLIEWYRESGFIPNVVIQDFMGDLSYEDVTGLLLALNTMDMDESSIKKEFPVLSKSILQAREQL